MTEFTSFPLAMYTYPMTGKAVLQDANNSLYQIPDYQREYAWGTREEASRDLGNPEVPEFWEDIFGDCWTKEHDHFIGTVLCTCSQREGRNYFDIVDGQQRLATLFLLCIALRDFFRENQLEHASWTRSLSDEQGQPRLVLSNRHRNDRATLANLLLNQDQIIAQTESEDNRMLAAYRWLRSAIFQKFSNWPEKALDFTVTVLNRITLLFVILEAKDDAPTIFKTMNDRGRPVDDLNKFRTLITLAVPQDRQLSEFACRVWGEIENTR